MPIEPRKLLSTGTRLTPYQKIMRAARCDRGLRLTRDEVFRLSMDTAIRERARRDRLRLVLG